MGRDQDERCRHRKPPSFLFILFNLLLFSALAQHFYTMRWDASVLLRVSLLGAALGLGGTAAVPFPDFIYDNGNSILNDNLDPAIFTRLGQYAPRYTVGHDSAAPPLGCSVDFVDSLERHGARYMTASALSSASKTVAKIQAALQNATTDLPGDLIFLRNVTLLTGTADLVPYGALQAYYSGRSTANTYPLLSVTPPFVRASGDEASLDDRVILTAKYWTLGFSGARFPSGTFANSSDVRAAGQTLKEPQVIFSENANQNNTLDVSTCTNENAIPDANGEKGAQQQFAQSTILPTVGARLQQRLIQGGAAKSLNLTGTDLINLASLCSFETLGRAVVQNGKLQVKQSDFCGMFAADEWAVLGYAFDVGKWKGAGYGNPYYKALGQGFLREYVARLNGHLPNVTEPTSLNSTVDSNPQLFPAPNALGGPSVFFDGSHDNNIGPIAAAAALFDGPALSTSFNAQTTAHAWIFSQIAPLQGKIVFERLSCLPGLQRYIRVRANDAILTPPSFCRGSKGRSNDFASKHNLCSVDDFLAGLAYVNTAQEWNKCYSSN
jgi:hypothetical protein